MTTPTVREAGMLTMLTLFTACSTTSLTEKGETVQILEGEVPPSCDYLGRVYGNDSSWTIASPAHNGAKAKVLNTAANKGANYVRFLSDDNGTYNSSVVGDAFKCGDTVGLAPEELKERCDKNSADACLDLGVALASTNHPAEADSLVDKACKLGSANACKIQVQYGRGGA